MNYFKEVYKRIKNRLHKGTPYKGNWYNQILFYCNLQDWCTDNCNYNNKCIRFEEYDEICKWCGAWQHSKYHKNK